ncbi:MAG: phosphomannomutase/phosphoglucomutase [Epsilonproteobacteria bacterium]|nr:phosphomannomutase/phosphoglucomutase [Campylobacterota bacterium]NPA56659.1 phosphomannomutase/phosphoglucomutase [Campylobacterota bacterium]
MHSIFREYDIRGIVGEELTEPVVKRIGYHLAQKVDGEYIAVGYDGRNHSPQLFRWLVSGINGAGRKVLDIGMVPTGVNYFSNFVEFTIEGRRVQVAASIQITGSHNPPEYNGFKITVQRAPFFGEEIYALGREVLASDLEIPDNPEAIPVAAKEYYIDYMAEEFSHLKGLRKEIVLDCGNGVAGVVLEPILKGLNIEYRGLYCQPDGNFPNHHPDPSEEENLEDLKRALRKGAIGFAYDGDGDRLAVVTENHVFKGDELAIIFARSMENPLVIGEVKCSQVMYDEINRIGQAIMYKTGHSNLKVKIAETGADLAAEVSGHLFFNDRYFGFDDAIYGTLRVLELIWNGVDLDRELEDLPSVYNTPEIKIGTDEGRKFEIIERLKERLKEPPEWFPPIREIVDVDGVRILFDNGWALVRASNTTPTLVTRFEAATQEEAALYQEAVMKVLEELL